MSVSLYSTLPRDVPQVSKGTLYYVNALTQCGLLVGFNVPLFLFATHIRHHTEKNHSVHPSIRARVVI